MANKAPTISFIDTLRANRAGALLSGLIVMVAVALVLGAAVPDDLNTLISLFLIASLAVAIGFTVKVTSPKVDAPSLLTAGGLAAMGVPLMFGAAGDGFQSFDQAILSSFNETYLLVGSALAAVVAIVVAAWGSRSE